MSDNSSCSEKDNQEQSTQNENKQIPYEELIKKLEESEQKTNQYWDRILRMQAEMENSLRRAERDIANAHKYGLEKFVLELLPIVDNLERSISTETTNVEAFVEGVHLTLKMFYSTLERFGVVQVDPTQKPFNPEYHEAVSIQEDTALEAGTVISVLQKGYLLNQRLVRPALVIVSKKAEVEK